MVLSDILSLTSIVLLMTTVLRGGSVCDRIGTGKFSSLISVVIQSKKSLNLDKVSDVYESRLFGRCKGVCGLDEYENDEWDTLVLINSMVMLLLM